LDLGEYENAVYVVATLLGAKWGVPSYWVDKEMSEVREEWRRSRIIRLWEYPEKKDWGISSFVKRLYGEEAVVIFEI
jgi:hypothetical protein